MNSSSAGFDDVIRAGSAHREATGRRRARQALAVSFGVLAVWLVFVTAAGHWERVIDHWASAVTMVFGSFVAGSTPQGGGAVAFPVFTKVLDIDASVARSFSLCIQAVGMGSAMLAIIVSRRTVEWRAVALATPAALVGFLFGILVLGDADQPYWPSRLPGVYVKVTFTLIVAAMAVVVWLSYRIQILEKVSAIPIAGPRVIITLLISALLGGVASALVGSGADVILYIAVVVIIGVTPRIGVPTSVVVMAIVSIVGFLMFGVIDGQLDVAIDSSGDVVALGGAPVLADGDAAAFGTGTPLDGGRFDLFGLWLAAAPIVAFGAPLGSWASSLVSDRQLVRFVIFLAALETVSTIIFVDGLASAPNPALILYAAAGGTIVIAGLALLRRYRRSILGLPAIDLDQPFTRDRLDVGPDFRNQLRDTPRDER